MTLLKVQNQIAMLRRQYKTNDHKAIEFDFRKGIVKMLNGFTHENKTLHYIHPYPGRVSPHIVSYFLSLNEFRHLDGYVLDPFAGTGTVLLESLINPIIKRPALGVEINPLGRLISKVKTSLLQPKRIQVYRELILDEYKKLRRGEYTVPKFDNIDVWFSLKAKIRLARLKHSIEIVEMPALYRDFFWVCFSKIIRKASNTDPNISPPVILKLFKYKKNRREFRRLKAILKSAVDPDVVGMFESAVAENSKLTALRSIPQIQRVKRLKAEVISDNAKAILRGRVTSLGKVSQSYKKLRKGSIDMVITSPPYLTAQKYLRSTRLELLWLGFKNEELRGLERLTIGSETISKALPISEFKVPSIEQLIDFARKRSTEKAAMITDYFRGMHIVLKELYRTLRVGGYSILIMGDNRVLSKPVKTHRLITDLASSIGFKEQLILKDRIRNRSRLSFNGSGGMIKYEYVILLKK